MDEFFKDLSRLAETDTNDYGGILGLTKEILSRAGYTRDENGVVRYDKPFDSTLTAKWLCYFKKQFFSLMHRNPRMGDTVFIDIVTSTFFSLFNSIDVSKLYSDESVCKLLSLVLQSRFIDMRRGKSPIRNGFDVSRVGTLFCTPNTVHNDEFDECQSQEDVSVSSCDASEYAYDVVYDLQQIVKRYKYGEVLIKGMLQSPKKLSIWAIDKYINIPLSEQTVETKKDLARAYNAICHYFVREGFVARDSVNRANPSDFKYTWEAKKRRAEA